MVETQIFQSWHKLKGFCKTYYIQCKQWDNWLVKGDLKIWLRINTWTSITITTSGPRVKGINYQTATNFRHFKIDTYFNCREPVSVFRLGSMSSTYADGSCVTDTERSCDNLVTSTFFVYQSDLIKQNIFDNEPRVGDLYASWDSLKVFVKSLYPNA